MKCSVLALGLLALLGVGCAAAPDPPTEARSPAAPTVGEYRLQSGDRVRILHVLDATYDAVVTLAPDGRIVVPGIRQPVEAGELTLPGLSRVLDAAFRASGSLRDPDFSLAIISFGEPHIYVGGEVGKPGAYDFGGQARSVLQVIMAAGGPLATARLSRVAVLRVAEDGHLSVVPANVAEVLDGRDLSGNILVGPRDVVVVPKTVIAKFDQWIDQYVRLVLPVPVSFLYEVTNGPYVPH